MDKEKEMTDTANTERLVEALAAARAALMECDRDCDYTLIGELDLLSSALAAAPEAPAAPTDANRDAYEGCREDLLDWKRRVLVAEENNRQLIRAMRAEFNGPTFMGEPAAPAVAVEGVGIHRLMKSGQGKFVPASEWFTGNPDPSWEKLVADEPDSWRIQRRVTGKQIATGIAKAFATPYVAPSVAEPVAHLWQHSETGRTRVVMSDQIITAEACWQVVGPLFLHPPAPREPLTDEQIKRGWTEVSLHPHVDARFTAGVRFAERRHIGTDREGGR